MESHKTFTWQYIFKIAMQHKKEFILVNILSILAALVYLPVPLIIPSLINEVLLKQPGFFTKALSYFIPNSLITPPIILVSAFLLVFTLRVGEEILRVIQGRDYKLISKDVVFNIRKQLLSRLEEITIKEYETLGSGKLATYYIKDLDTIDEFLGVTVSKVVIALLFLIGIIVVLFCINWKVALFILLFNPFSLILTSTFAKKLKALKAEQNKAFELFQEAFIETIDAIIQIRADHKESGFIDRLIKKAKQVKDESIAYEWKTEVVGDLAGMLLFIGVDLYYVFCMVLILHHDFTIGMMIALLQYVFMVQFYMKDVVSVQSAFYAADAALTRINQTMAFETEPKYITKRNPFEDQSGIAIDIKGLDFSYSEKKPVLSNINMSIQSNKRIAIVGSSGSGKSTLIQALLGFYPINQGEIKINNTPLYDIGFDVVRDNISVVLQNPTMLNDTIRNNLTYYDDISDADIWRALEMAQLNSTIKAMELQLETQIGKKGVRLSGGQRQRLAIARMLLRNPKVVILDEATSALDLKTEHALFESLQQFLSERTSIIIAHRLSTIIDSDIIYVINNGTMAEQGCHDELMKSQGIYYSLYKLQ